MDKNELKPCPFCGGKDIEGHHVEDAYYERCNGCGAEGPPIHGPRDDGTDWNTRQSPKAMIAEGFTVMACTGCGWVQGVPLGATAIACCPDNRYREHNLICKPEQEG